MVYRNAVLEYLASLSITLGVAAGAAVEAPFRELKRTAAIRAGSYREMFNEVRLVAVTAEVCRFDFRCGERQGLLFRGFIFFHLVTHERLCDGVRAAKHLPALFPCGLVARYAP